MKRRIQALMACIAICTMLPATIFAQADPIPGGCGVVGPNEVENPEFDLGNSGFSSSYLFNPGYICGYGQYTIASTVVNDPNVVCYGAPGFNLRTIWAASDRNEPGAGQFLMVDPSEATGANDDVWAQSLSVCPNSQYTFSVFAKNIYYQEGTNYPGSEVNPEFELTINGDTVAGYYVDGVLQSTGSYELNQQPQADSASWMQISGTWNSGNSTQALLQIRNLISGSQGNDLAIDNVFFGLCGRSVSLNQPSDIQQCTQVGAPNPVQPVTFSVSQETNNSQWQYFRLFRDNVAIAEDASTIAYTTNPSTNEHFGTYKLIAYDDPLGVSCAYESKNVAIVEDCSVESTFPVEWLAFDASVQTDRSVRLDWGTASELNNRGFAVEYRQDRAPFQEAGFVSGAGNSQQAQYYAFQTASLPAGTYEFRLRQIDFDGGEDLSRSLMVQIGQDGTYDLRLYPNPASQSTQLFFQPQRNEQLTIHLLSLQGQRIQTIYQGSMAAGVAFNQQINLSQLSQGLYLLQIKGATFQTYRKLRKE